MSTSKINKIKSIIKSCDAIIQRRYKARSQNKFSKALSFSEAVDAFPNRNDIYAYMHHHLHNLSPNAIKEHRLYYSKNKRGFGEDALHAMWWTLLQEFKPKLLLEIGVYRGQIVTLWGLIAKLNNLSCEVHGISPFLSSGDQVSNYLTTIDYMKDTLESNQYFKLPNPFFLKALSTDSNAIEYIKSHQWDLIYIDGNHDYDIALLDYKNCRDSLAKGGLLIMDDSSLYTDFKPPAFSFAGHPGPSRIVQELAIKELHFLGGVGHNNVFMKV